VGCRLLRSSILFMPSSLKRKLPQDRAVVANVIKVRGWS